MSDLYTRTLQLLDERTDSLQTIANAANVGYHWLAKLSQRQIPDPGVQRMQRLHDYLAAKDASTKERAA